MDIEDMIQTCEGVQDIPKHNGGPGFSQWDQEFLESIREQFDNRGSLSEKQIAILKSLYDRT